MGNLSSAQAAGYDSLSDRDARSVLTVANTILQQLGGNRFKIMTGAKDFIGDETSLMFRIPRAKDGINKVRVTLDLAIDLYSVEFMRVNFKKYTFETVHTSNQVYFDDLERVFTEHTGLYTRL
ncbi:hypothetical protein FY034_18035 (plasmid) [Trichlorobacter lovleyi]|uniref:hypothetical protein n=1 Tax=Trichlorobacter lovleyi TaxID=313985 RepID=UPI0022401FA8|nr:hypothetical protein [Trichlorobacter lovleyi]QOX80901.1 hypothetical protein FY034_18035 [Trichlorobacter lovleyi]